MSLPNNPFEIAQRQLDEAAAILGLSPAMHAFLREPAQYAEKQQQAEQRPDRMRHAYPPPSLFLHALHARRWAATAHIRRQSLQYVAQRQRIQIHTSSRNTP